MGSLSIWHWLIVLAIVTLIFGTRRLRNIGGDLGAAIRDFRAATHEAGNSNLQSEERNGR